MPEPQTIQNFLLVGSSVFLSLVVFMCMMRAALGPRFSDRMIAAVMLGNKIVLLVAVLALLIGENYLAEMCLIFAIVNFLLLVVLARSVTEKDTKETIK
ncbi:MAG: sodium:proton antiporter [Synergistaceae bacterium]|nr:sodium:proton antiporter [Synergistaceae bacterium]MBR0093886.1 sodium:proton antiporter [Synergistaceae bacterium]